MHVLRQNSSRLPLRELTSVANTGKHPVHAYEAQVGVAQFVSMPSLKQKLDSTIHQERFFFSLCIVM
jgi:hypothetical protein